MYRAERLIWKHGEKFQTVGEMQVYVDKVMSSAWFKRRWPYVARGGITVLDGRGRRSACAQDLWGVGMAIKMPTWSRSEPVILHEIAHHCADEIHGSNAPGHGWGFTSTFLELITHEMGPDVGDELKQSFKEHNVRFRAPRAKRKLTEEQREVLRERMAVARAAKAARLDSVEV